jgi:hypothetical protein
MVGVGSVGEPRKFFNKFRERLQMDNKELPGGDVYAAS